MLFSINVENRIYRKQFIWRESFMQAINNATSTIKEIWSYQHPVMHTWFLFSAASLGCMFALLFFAI